MYIFLVKICFFFINNYSLFIIFTVLVSVDKRILCLKLVKHYLRLKISLVDLNNLRTLPILQNLI